jgi:hypothetical protein
MNDVWVEHPDYCDHPEIDWEKAEQLAQEYAEHQAMSQHEDRFYGN